MRIMHSSELRHRAVLHYQLHMASLRKVSKLYKVGKSTLSRWIKRSVREADRPRRRSRTTLHERIAEAVDHAIKKQPFQTADSLAQAVMSETSAKVSRSTIHRSLAKLGQSYKRSARSRDHEPVPHEHPFLAKDSYEGNVIAVDESSFYWNDVPSMGWGPKGISLILAIGAEGVVHHEVRIGGVKAAHFAEFVRCLPDGRPLICDNCSIHKAPCVRAVYAAKGIELRLIPPYCPWYNPVEFCFSEIKRRYRPVRLLTPAADFVDDVLSCMRELRWHESYFRHARERCELDRSANG